MAMTTAREIGCGTRRNNRAPKYPPASAMTAIGNANRQSTMRAMTKGTSATPLIDTASTFLTAFCALKLGRPGKRQHREHQDAHAGAEITAVDRDEKLHRDLPGSVPRAADRRVNHGPSGKDGSREQQQPRDHRSKIAAGVTQQRYAPDSAPATLDAITGSSTPRCAATSSL